MALICRHTHLTLIVVSVLHVLKKIIQSAVSVTYRDSFWKRKLNLSRVSIVQVCVKVMKINRKLLVSHVFFKVLMFQLNVATTSECYLSGQ